MSKHLIVNLSGDLKSVRQELLEAHQWIVKCCHLPSASQYNLHWGVELKRYPVDLSGVGCPNSIGKDSERLSEVINILATVERLLDALDWFVQQNEFMDLIVAECHPATSSGTSESGKGNDLILANRTTKERRVLCEVSDIASSNPHQNKKEAKELASLGYDKEKGIPNDGIRRFICTSTQFANSLASGARKDIYQRAFGDSTDANSTTMLEILPS